MSDDEDDYIAFGAPLKPLDDANIIRKKPIAVEEQIVRDVNGIRRFHGAFTGGWSAGHFNTVNTPQGWTPQQFKSSREAKGERAAQRPEDFMDDEDRDRFVGFAAEAVKTKSSFQGSGASADSSKAVLPGAALLEQLVQPVQGTVGEELLTRQGWKPGQGIGPKVTRRRKQATKQSYSRTYGCSGPEEQEEEEVDPMLEKYRDFLFAPDEIPVSVARPKDNFFGIGYSGLARGTGAPLVHGASDYQVSTSLQKLGGGRAPKKFSITGEAFGVGADEEDDISIYSHGSLAEYDFSLDVNESRERKTVRKKEKSRWETPAAGLDSLLFLVGFVSAKSRSQLKKVYPVPEVPHNWTPRRQPGKRKSRFEPAAEPAGPRGQAAAVSQGGTNPSVEQRRARLFPDQANRGVRQEEPLKEEPVRELPEFLLGEHKADGSFRPFARDEKKQKRYEQYQVCLQNDRPELLPSLQPKTMTSWEKEREKVEFERASLLFQPMKGVIGSRFVSAGDSESVDAGEGSVVAGVKDPDLAAREAAAMGLYGQLTRRREEWHPARLLCVRFNVAHPYSDHSVTGVAKPAKRETGVTNVFAALEGEQETEGMEETKTDPDAASGAVAEIKVEEEEVVQPKPPMDIFKAIFADSDSESEVEDDVSEKAETVGNHLLTKTTTDTPKNPWEEREGNVLRSQAPAKGIFANIDFDALNKRPSSKRPRSPSQSPPRDNRKPGNGMSGGVEPKKESGDGSSSDDSFGPALPPGLAPSKVVAKVESITISTDSEGTGGRRKRRKKDKKKKHKTEKKRKKKKGREASIVISSGSEEVVEVVEKRKKLKKHKSRA